MACSDGGQPRQRDGGRRVRQTIGNRDKRPAAAREQAAGSAGMSVRDDRVRQRRSATGREQAAARMMAA